MKHQLITLKTITPLHCGVGSGASDIDLPVAKSPVTGFPLVPGSSLKGVLKDRYRNDGNADGQKVTALFGPGTDKAGDHASAISVGDSQLLALPVRSFFGCFAFLTSPLALTQFKEACAYAGMTGVPDIPVPGSSDQDGHYKATVTETCVLLAQGGRGIVAGGRTENQSILLEEIDLLVDPTFQSVTTEWAEFLAGRMFNDPDAAKAFKSRFVVANDDILNFMCETALPVEPHIAINGETGTVRQGALWYEEQVPPETIFYGLIHVDRSYAKSNPDDESAMLAFLRKHMPPVVQVGGKSTTGKGLMSITAQSEDER